MSKARLVITAVIQQNRSVAEVAASYGVHRATVYHWLARWRLEGEAAYEPKSRRPHTNPTATPDDVVQAVLAERDRLSASVHDTARKPSALTWPGLGSPSPDTTPARKPSALTWPGLGSPSPEPRPPGS